MVGQLSVGVEIGALGPPNSAPFHGRIAPMALYKARTSVVLPLSSLWWISLACFSPDDPTVMTSASSGTWETVLTTTSTSTQGTASDGGQDSDRATGAGSTSDVNASGSSGVEPESTTAEDGSGSSEGKACTEAEQTCEDECPSDPEKVIAGICGCGHPDWDGDSDGIMDCNDDCPTDPAKVMAGACGCGAPDIDSDSDGAADCADECPHDPALTTSGDCGCPDAPLIGRFCGPGRICDALGECELQPGTGILAAGPWDTCILTAQGAVACQSTTGETVDFGHEFRAFQIGVGLHHACALFEDGSVRCWGDGALATEHGQLGTTDFTIGDDGLLDPADVGDVELGEPALRISVGASYNCAVLESGAVRCWGENTLGQLGVGTTLDMGDDPGEMPPPDVPLSRQRAVEVAAGNNHTCAILEGGAVRCWGRGFGGALGYGSEADQLVPPDTNVELSGPAVQIDTGSSHTCAVLENAGLQCWGYNAGGQLGYGTTSNVGDNETPASVGAVPVPGPVVEVVIGQGTAARAPIYTCARFEDGAVRCWGENSLGGLGYRHSVTIGDNETPAEAEDETYFNARLQADVPLGGPLEIGFPSFAIALAHGGDRCLMRSDLEVLCWGVEQQTPIQTGLLSF